MIAPTSNVLRVGFALPGFHRVSRGAETALEAVARVLASRTDFAVTLIGGGRERAGEPYQFRHAALTPRERYERWPRIPPLRNEYRWEELSFAGPLRRAYRPEEFDITVTCSYPFVNWVLRARRKRGLPKHVFVTQNGDWPARRSNAEYRFFGCDGLVCTNPDYFERHAATWRSALIPNGIDAAQFHPGAADRTRHGIPAVRPVVLMVAAQIPSKRTLEGLRAVAKRPELFLLAVGDGPLRSEFDALAASLLPGRCKRITADMAQMPDLYRCADVFLHMSREEAFGNVYVEALASGLPVVAHDYATTRWIFSAGNAPTNLAWLVDTNDETATVNALQDALHAPRELVAPRHAAAASRFDWPVVGERYASFLREVARA